ncbi:DUF1540 domain-containing protein [Thermovenabulum gondwanense]|uniref:DUF1540 domain-containing protein n=1 Tax=Thermovenabulum gondwanense TaxID=520767 RepID=A0A161PYX3_9FIRM|nr:DUF1540 domain-containing protein [Thermovenabulum gondwanense]KYO67809.1 hypothetical protein ATZ99_04490 [Thermovenabulum gondwanense]
MPEIRCNVASCRYNRDNVCHAESVLVNAIRPGCSSKEGTYCDAFEHRNSYKEKDSQSNSKFMSLWD